MNEPKTRVPGGGWPITCGRCSKELWNNDESTAHSLEHRDRDKLEDEQQRGLWGEPDVGRRYESPAVATAALPEHAALNELAAVGSHLAHLFSIVSAGATLVVTGPDPLGPVGSPRFGCSLESTTGTRHADAYGSTLAVVFDQLLTEWGKL